MHTIAEAKKYINDNFEEGVECPCCERFTRLNKYSFHTGMAKCLILIRRGMESDQLDCGWLRVENYLFSIGHQLRGYHSKLKYWGLIEQRENTDTSKAHSGYWRLTSKGSRFISGRMKLPKKVFLFNDTIFGFSDETGDIHDMLNKKFDYAELMGRKKNIILKC